MSVFLFWSDKNLGGAGHLDGWMSRWWINKHSKQNTEKAMWGWGQNPSSFRALFLCEVMTCALMFNIQSAEKWCGWTAFSGLNKLGGGSGTKLLLGSVAYCIYICTYTLSDWLSCAHPFILIDSLSSIST